MLVCCSFPLTLLKAYISCFIIFVMLLKQGHYAYQFQQFAWIHMALFSIVVSLQFVVYNTTQGMIWFVLPVTLINVNDIFAYFSGVAFGRTKLIDLSPKKTVEGFIGAAIATAICAFVLTGSLVNYQSMICPLTQYGATISCQPDSIYIAKGVFIFFLTSQTFNFQIFF
jgi:phosphatidate cytidylyltransferase